MTPREQAAFAAGIEKRRTGVPSTLLRRLDQIARLQRFEHDHAGRHREDQHQQDDAQAGTLAGTMPRSQDPGGAGGDEQCDGERQGGLWGSEGVEHGSRFPRRARTGPKDKRRRGPVFLVGNGLSERERA
jgi:hypothetical protein